MTLQQEIAIVQELESSIKLIELGIGEYQNLNQSNNFYFLPFQLISSGLERLMKCYICLGFLEKNDKYPNFRYIKNLGHDLINIQNHILINFYNTNGILELERDLLYLETNEDLKKLILILSEFGKYARYHNLDIITASSNPSINAQSEWEEFEDQLILRDSNLINKLGEIEFVEEVYNAVKQNIIISLEKYVRSLCRQFTLGGLGGKAKQLSPIVFHFIILEDNKLGKTDYRKNTTRYSSNKRNPYKRTILDNLKRLTNRNYKSKKIHKSEFEHVWPFYADEVIIECRYKYWCIVTIKGYDYGLNGASQGKYNLVSVYDAGEAILGKSISLFISMALELGQNN